MMKIRARSNLPTGTAKSRIINPPLDEFVEHVSNLMRGYSCPDDEVSWVTRTADRFIRAARVSPARHGQPGRRQKAVERQGDPAHRHGILAQRRNPDADFGGQRS